MRAFQFLVMLTAFASSKTGWGQNLVPNFSFEEYSNCPDNEDQIEYSTGWKQYSESITTPDYYNACSQGNFSVPNNILGVQSEPRNCSAYIGLGTWASSSEAREHVGIQLTNPLTIGQKYFISFKTVMADNKFSGSYFGVPANNIGIKLSTIEFNESDPIAIDNSAHVYSSNIISDSINWTLVSGSIIADSNYRYLSIGNFFDNSNTDTIRSNCGNCLNFNSYYYVDDVCLSTDSTFCNSGINSLPCFISLIELAATNSFEIYPNPANETIIISSSKSEDATIIISNLIGELVYTQQLINSTSMSIDISSFPDGFYAVTIIANNHQLKNKFLKI